MIAPRSPIIAFLGLVLGSILMGMSPMFVRLADVGPFASAFWRVFLALPPLWLWMRMASEPPSNNPACHRAILFSGLAFTGDLIFWHLSILHTTIANATLLATIAPLWVFLVAFLVFGQHLRRLEILGLVICLIGGIFLIGDSFTVDPSRLRGDAEGLITSFFFGLYIVFIGIARKHTGPARITFWSTAITAACLLVAALVSGDVMLPSSLRGWAVLAGLAFFSQAAGQGLLAYALGNLPTAFSSLVVFMEAVAAAALGWIVLNEPLGIWQWAGGFLVLFGIWLARPRPASKPVEQTGS